MDGVCGCAAETGRGRGGARGVPWQYLKLGKDIPVVVAGAYCAKSQLEAVFYYAFLRLGIFGTVDGHFC
jgi:hypothetical protein